MMIIDGSTATSVKVCHIRIQYLRALPWLAYQIGCLQDYKETARLWDAKKTDWLQDAQKTECLLHAKRLCDLTTPKRLSDSGR